MTKIEKAMKDFIGDNKYLLVSNEYWGLSKRSYELALAEVSENKLRVYPHESLIASWTHHGDKDYILEYTKNGYILFELMEMDKYHIPTVAEINFYFARIGVEATENIRHYGKYKDSFWEYYRNLKEDE